MIARGCPLAVVSDHGMHVPIEVWEMIVSVAVGSAHGKVTLYGARP